MLKSHLLQDFTQLPADFYRHQLPEPQPHAQLIIQNNQLLSQLNCTLNATELLDLTAGTLQQVDCQPLAQKYVGHQFGYYNPDLGDGRGLLLGQWHDKNDQAWDFHLKGAGRTPYSRQGDGRAVLRSCIREFLASEALYGLGIPTTRALTIATSSEKVKREMLEPRASLIRVTPSHIRFGHFQWAANQGEKHFKALVAFVIQKHFPQWQIHPFQHQAWLIFDQACQNTAKLLAQWKSFGFSHGVMNTDNMSILGETFDFGPYAFLDDYQADFICNHSDYEGRYGYNQQANIGLWNCKILAGSFADWVDNGLLEQSLQAFVDNYYQHYRQQMLHRLGLDTTQSTDMTLIIELLERLNRYAIDYSLFFRRLALWQTESEFSFFHLLPEPEAFSDWLNSLEKRIQQEQITDSVWRQRIQQRNPSVILRNYIAQDIIIAAEHGNTEPLHHWLKALQSPFKAHRALSKYQQPPLAHQKGFQLSCSS